jgi:type I restriction enzyme S subunit
MLSARNIANGQIEFSNFRYISSEDFDLENARTQITPGDVLLTIVGTIGRTAVVPETIRQFTLQRSVAVLKPIEVIPKFCMYQLQSPSVQQLLSDLAKGTVQKGVYLKVLADLPLVIAPLPEQQRIVDEIETQFTRLEATVSSLKRVEENLKRFRFSTLKAAYEGQLVPTENQLAQGGGRGYESAEQLLVRIWRERYLKWEASQLTKMKMQSKVPKDETWKENYNEPIAPDWSSLPELPEGWTWATTDSVFTFITSGSRGWAKYYSDDGALFLRVGNLNRNSISLDLTDVQRVSPPKGAEGTRTKVIPRDILISITADVGMIGLVPENLEPAYINQHIALARPVESVDAKFLAWCLASEASQRQFLEMERGITKAGLGLDNIRSVIVPLPPLNEQRRIAIELERRVSVIDELESLVRASLTRVEVLRQRILKRAFEGKLVPQDPNDESAEELLKRMASKKTEMEKNKKASNVRIRKLPKAGSTNGDASKQLQLPFKITPTAKRSISLQESKVQNMKLISLKIDGDYKSLHNFEQTFRDERDEDIALSPICLVGLNGSGKSNLIEALCEIFCYLEIINLPYEKISQRARQTDLRFEVEYELPIKHSKKRRRVRIVKHDDSLPIFSEIVDDEEKPIDNPESQLDALPTKIIGYSSGLNETISVPFFRIKSFYSDEVAERAIKISGVPEGVQAVADTRTLFMDYDSNAAILLANYLFSSKGQLQLFRDYLRIEDIASFKITIQLSKRRVKLTPELEDSIARLQECATEIKSEEKAKKVTFIYEITPETRTAFREHFKDSKRFFTALYKLSLLNALAMKRTDRRFFLREDIREGLLERPPTVSKEDKIFNIEQLRLKLTIPEKEIDYAGISDGEHQFIHVFGTVKLFDDAGCLFLFDEPETHFNPRWRREFVQLLNDIPSSGNQEFIISTHSPFIVSGCHRENVFKFERQGDIAICTGVDFETFGSSFEFLLTKLFDLKSLISEQAFEELREVLQSNDLKELEGAVGRFGESFEKRFLFERIAQVRGKKK